MAKGKTAAKASKTLTNSNGRHGRAAAGSALTQAPIERRSETKRSRRAEPTADELGLLAWKTTYKNRRTKTK